MSPRVLAAVASLYGLLAVMLAALGAHLLPAEDAAAHGLWATALQIHMFHAVALLAVAALAQTRKSVFITRAGFMMAVGVLLFSASLYLRASGFDQLPGLITPVGGAIIMLAWALLIVILIRKSEI